MKRFFGFLLLAAGALVFAAIGRQQATASPQWEMGLTASPNAYEGKCPALIHLKGFIKLNSWQGKLPVTVKYSLLNSDGIDSFEMTGTIAAVPGSLTITDARTPTVSGVYWVKIHLHLGGPAADLYSDPARFVVRCTNRPIGVNPNETPKPTATPCVATFKPCQPTPCPPSAAGVPCKPNPNTTPTPCPAGVNCHPASTPTPCPPTVPGCNPNATPTPCPPSAVNLCHSPPPCHDATGKPIPCGKLADLTAGPDVIVGGSVGGGPLPSGVVGQHVAWGGSVVLSDKDAFLISNGRCAFNLSYVLRNIGGANAAPAFKDVIRAGASVVSIQSALLQDAGTQQAINTQAYLPAPGPYTLSLTINDGHVATESNYFNNYFTIKYTLDTSKCMGH